MKRSIRALLTLAMALAALAVPAGAIPQTRPVPTALNIAHRGASGLAPEHTFTAWDLAIELGAHMIEQDVQTTADGHLVVIHDDTLDRTTDCSGPVRSKTLAQIRSCDAGSWFNEANPDLADPAFVGLKVPTLAEVFERYGTSVTYHIETKTPEGNPVVERELLRLLDIYDLREAAHTDWQVVVQSFSPASLQRMHALDPAMPLVQLLPSTPPAQLRDAFLDTVAEYAIGVGPSHGGVEAGFIEAAHSQCLEVHPYTVDAPERMRELLDAGVDGLFTNRPDRLDAILFEDRRLEPADDAMIAALAAAARENRACRATTP